MNVQSYSEGRDDKNKLLVICQPLKLLCRFSYIFCVLLKWLVLMIKEYFSSTRALALPALFAGTLLLGALATISAVSAAPPAAPARNIKAPPAGKNQPKPVDKKPGGNTDKEKTEKKAETKTPEVILENVQSVNIDDLVKSPSDYLGKNVKFGAKFYAFSNLALDYKPALKSSKTHLSFVVLSSKSHVPLSELKLAMMIPKDKDPETQLLASLKDGDQIECIGKVFSAAIGDPWVEVFKVKKIGGADPKKDVTAKADDGKESSSERKENTNDKNGGGEPPASEKDGSEGTKNNKPSGQK